MRCQEVQDQIPAYVLGAHSPGDQRRLEAHLKRCPTCLPVLREHLETVGNLAATVPARDPSPRVKDALLRRVQASRSRARRTLSLGPAWAWQTALALLVIALVASLLGVALSTRRQVGQLEAETRRLAALAPSPASSLALSRPEGALERYDLVSLLARPDRRVFRARQQVAEPDIKGILLTPGDMRWGVITVVGLQPLPPGQRYQVWLQSNGQPIPGGFLLVDDSGWGQTTLRPAEPFSSFQRISVTVEPTAGGVLPASPPVFDIPLVAER